MTLPGGGFGITRRRAYMTMETIMSKWVNYTIIVFYFTERNKCEINYLLIWFLILWNK
jgi:hypothetical protein